MRPVRVLYLTDNPNLGASARILGDWVRAAPGAGVAFHFALAQSGALSSRLEEEGVPYVVTQMPWLDRRRVLQFAWSARRLALQSRRWGIDVVHAEHNVYPFAAPVARLMRRPILCHVHYLVERGYAEWAFTGWRAPDHVLWTSHAQRSECRDAVDGLVPDSKQSISYLGVSLTTFGTNTADRERLRGQWSVGPDTLVIGAANAIRPRKRVEDFIELIDTLASRHSQVVGVLAGSAPPGDEGYEREMRQLSESRSLRGRLLWMGNLERIEPFMQAIDVFVSTSGHETFGMSICEAMACGKPVVVYRASSAGEVVGADGIVIETGDIRALIGEVERLITNPELRGTLGKRARARVASTFDPNVSLAQLASVYRSLVRSGHSGRSKDTSAHRDQSK